MRLAQTNHNKNKMNMMMLEFKIKLLIKHYKNPIKNHHIKHNKSNNKI